LNAALTRGPVKFKKQESESDMSSDMSDSEDDEDDTAPPVVKLTSAEQDMRMALQAQLMGKLAGKKPKSVIEKEER
jgi:hypothetical protein